MTTLLTITEGSARMMVHDPHGLNLTVICIMVVFCSLLILFGFYSLSGAILSGKLKRRAKPADGGADEAETEAAIATALHLYLSGRSHDKEPGIITIRPRKDSGWADKSLTLRNTNR